MQACKILLLDSFMEIESVQSCCCYVNCQETKTFKLIEEKKDVSAVVLLTVRKTMYGGDLESLTLLLLC